MIGTVLRRVAVGATIFFAVLGLMFGDGYAIEDPGGWAAAGIIALQLVVIISLSVLAVSRPALATTFLLVGALVLVAYGVTDAVNRPIDAPVLPMAALVLAIPIAVLGLEMPNRAAGLLALVAASALVEVMGAGFRNLAEGEGFRLMLGGSSGVVVLPLLVLAGLFLLAASLEHAEPRQPVNHGRTRPAH